MYKKYINPLNDVKHEKNFLLLCGFEKFREMSLPIISKYEGKALIRNPNPDLREGSNSGLVIVLEFASFDHAKRFYESEEYSLAKQVREKASSTELILVEGI